MTLLEIRFIDDEMKAIRWFCLMEKAPTHAMLNALGAITDERPYEEIRSCIMSNLIVSDLGILHSGSLEDCIHHAQQHLIPIQRHLSVDLHWPDVDG